ncbi:MAG: adenylate/guanylate cyclase domain-containing protein, partial [Solirubrobacterales bacterium]
ARDRPIVIVLDDLHWADEPSLLLLKFAAREIGSSGLLVVGTYRDVELGRHHPLARVLGEISGTEGSVRVNFRGLSVDAVERYIGMTAGAAPPPGLAEAVQSQTDGNPFFVGEVVRLLASEGHLSDPDAWQGVIPQGVREVVGRRLDRLSEPTNEALRVAAAIGREFEEQLLVAVTDLSPEELLTAAGEAISERLVTELGEGRYSFSHALVRDTLYDEASPAQRAALHERIGLALEEICGDEPEARLGELAHHFLSAAPRGDIGRAIDYAERAGAQAMDQLAYEEAAELYERALEVLELSDEPDETRRCALLLALGGARMSAGNFADSRQAYERAAAGARALGDTDRLVGAALGIALLSEAGNVDDSLVELLDHALEAVGPGPSAERASLLSAKAQELYWVDAQTVSAPLAKEAVEIAREVGDPQALATALHRMIFIPIEPDSQKERLAIADEMLQLGESSGDREMVVRSHAYKLREFLELGDIAAVDRELSTYARLAEDLRMPQHIWHTFALRAMRAMIDGELGEAEELAGEARRRGERAEQPLATQYYGVQLILLRRFQGRSDELLPAVRDLAERYPAIPAWRTALISLEALGGHLEEGRLELERFAGADFSAIPRDANWLPAMGLIGEATALLGDTERSALVYEQLLPYDGLVIVPARAAAAQGSVARVLGLLARALGRLDDAQAHLESAVEMATRMGDRPFLAEARVQLAELLLARDRRANRDQALELLSEALSSARQIGARGIADQALALRLEAQGLAGVDITTSIDEVVSALESEQPDLRAHAAPDGTVAILFSDIEDSTMLTERLGDERWLEVLREHNRVFREQIARHGGYEVKSQGDGFMLAFPDPCEALECAVSVQRAFAEREQDGSSDVRGRSAGEAEERPVLRVRIGLHTGEVIAEEGDFFGKNVILAARIAAQACGGEILVSDEMRAAAGDGNGFAFDQGRELELKGLAGSHKVFRADWQAQAAATS